MTKQAALIALARNRGEIDARLLARLLARAGDDVNVSTGHFRRTREQSSHVLKSAPQAAP